MELNSAVSHLLLTFFLAKGFRKPINERNKTLDLSSATVVFARKSFNCAKLLIYNDKKPQGVLPYQTDGDARRKFGKKLLRGTKILFCGRGLNFFSRKWNQFLHNTSPVVSFSAQ